MDKLLITKDMIRVTALYAIVMNWSIDQLREVYEYLGVPYELVNETLREI